ncbi:MAG: VanZ family protein [Vicinamibacterales bacterium]
MARLIFLWAPPVATMIGMFLVSSQHQVPVPLPGRTDLLAHLTAYGGLTLLLVRACAGGRWAGVTTRALTAAWVVAAAWGVSDEIHQMFVPGRSAGPDDWLADATGAALAVIVSRAAARGIARRRAARDAV